MGLWVSILDPDVTESPTRGMYLAYLFSEDRQRVSLSLNQGTTQAAVLAKSLPLTTRELLLQEAEAVRSQLPVASIRDLEYEISLGKSSRVRLYEAGNIVATSWEAATLPTEKTLVNSLERLLDLYSQAISVKRRLKLTGSTKVHTASDNTDLNWTPEVRFEPKNSSEYLARISQHEQIRSRSHEDVVRNFGVWAASCGYTPNTNVHPRDLVLHGMARDVLVEVKVYASGRPRLPLRECIGQLFEYRYFFGGDPHLVACLSSNPLAYADLFEELGIGVCWQQDSRWFGSPTAVRLGLGAAVPF